MGETVTSQAGRFSVRSEAHGPHWVAWLTSEGGTKPVGDLLLVGETREEAEARAHQWLEAAAAQGYL